MTALSKSQPNNITSPNGNSLAIYIDGDTGVLMLKDIYGKIQPLADYLTSLTTTKIYGSFYSLVTQQPTQINTPTAMTFENTDSFSSGASIVSNSQITVSESGVYNLQFSAQISRTSGGNSAVIDIWFRKNGDDITNSDTQLSIQSNAGKLVASWNYFVDLNAGENVEIMYASTLSTVQLFYSPEDLTVPHPAIPSIIATIEKIN